MSCDALTGGSQGDCARVWVSTDVDVCESAFNTTCAAIASSSVGMQEEEVEGGVAYGAPLSICCDVVIAVGLGLQVCGRWQLSLACPLPSCAQLQHATLTPPLLLLLLWRAQKLGHKRVARLPEDQRDGGILYQPVWVPGKQPGIVLHSA